ncbi:MAG TPA: methyltransferase, partial [Candidatus Paceibacterota bacterium]|nr:methyltransferase [Candidatus Paceibacterota bacterium]
TSYTEREVRVIPYFNNTFLYLDEATLREKDPMEQMLHTILHSSQFKKRLSKIPSFRSFKIVTSLENQTVAIDRPLLQSLERSVIILTKARLNITRPEKEIWLIARSEGVGFAGMRLTYPYYKDKKPHSGELRSELATILSLASHPSPTDTVLDPFAGYGAIPFERAKAFPYKSIIANDNDARFADHLKKSKASLRKTGIEVRQEDALQLLSVADSSIDKIITDPPWGVYASTEMPLSTLYARMLEQFHRVLKPRGIAVVLMGAPREFESVLELVHLFQEKERYSLLVSGKKATLYVLRKQKTSSN